MATGPFSSSSARGIRNLSGKLAVVTGAASGIGRALALGLWKKGCRLALVDVDHAGLARLRLELGASGDVRGVTTHSVDVGDRERMRQLAGEVVDAHGAVHVLINNAGIAHEGMFPETSLDDWERIIDVNLWGVIHGCHYFMPHLAKVERGHIVNLSSLFGIIGMGSQSAYCTSKFAVRGLSESLWEELRGTSVGLTLVHPGAVATNMIKRSLGDDRELLQRVNRWYERRAMAPERAVAKIIRAIEHGTPRLLIGPEVPFGDLLKRLMPVTGNRLIVDAVIRTIGLEDVRDKRTTQWRERMVAARDAGRSKLSDADEA